MKQVKLWMLVIFACLSLSVVAAPQSAAQVSPVPAPQAVVSPSAAQPASQLNEKKSADSLQKTLRVGVIVEPPFVNKSQGNYKGIVPALWKSAAEKSDLHYQFLDAGDNVDDALKVLASGKYDALIGPITVTTGRLKLVHFSRPFYVNRLSAITADDFEGFWAIIWHMIKTFFAWSLLVYFAFIFVYSIYHWIAERRRGKKEFQGNPLVSYLHSFFVIFYYFLIRKFPGRSRSLSSRILIIIWAVASIIFSSQLIATITSAMTVSHSDLNFDEKMGAIHSLYDRKVAVHKGSYAGIVADRLGADVTTVDHLPQAFDLLKQKKVNIVLGDYLTLSYFIKKHRKINFAPNPVTVGVNEMAFAFPKNSPLRDKIDASLSYMQEHNETYGICRAYLDAEDSQACVI